jgi:hypothetical protein
VNVSESGCKGDELMTIKSFLSRKAFANSGFIALALLLSLTSARAQHYEITPLVGGTFFGTMKLGQPDMPNVEANIADSFSFGLVAGYRFEQDSEGTGVIAFRWIRQNSHLTLNQNPLAVTPFTSVPSFRPSVTLDNFLADFSREFKLDEQYQSIQPFISVSLGAATMGTPASSATRFSFGFGGGIKVFPSKHYGFRLGVDYLPVVMTAEVQRLVCVGGACTFALGGGIMNQFEVSVGPAFRF